MALEDARVPYAVVDAFTDEAFGGNPAAVCLVPAGADSAWMQKVAAEFNISETSFLTENKVHNGSYDYELRWFTPTVEVDLCGHATLASAHYLFTNEAVSGDVIRFKTKSGVLSARKTSHWCNGDKAKSFLVELDFPITGLRDEDDDKVQRSGLSQTLKNCSVLTMAETQLGDLIVEVCSQEEVENLVPNFPEISSCSTRGLIVTAKSDNSQYDFVSRFFCPNYGINEDPVCGSAHCALTPFWSKKLGKNRMTAFQVSQRGGKLGLYLDSETQRVRLSGESVIVMVGTLI